MDTITGTRNRTSADLQDTASHGCRFAGKSIEISEVPAVSLSPRLLHGAGHQPVYLNLALLLSSLVFSTVGQAAQSLDEAINGALQAGCLALDEDSLTGDLRAFCDAGGGSDGATSSTGGTLSSQAGLSGLENAATAEERLEKSQTGETSTLSAGPASLFVSVDYATHHKDDTTIEGNGYKSDRAGITGGINYAFSDSFAAGLAVSFSENDGDFDGDNSGGFDTASRTVLLFASVLPTAKAYADLAIGYTSHDYEMVRFATAEMGFGDAQGLLSGDTDGDEIEASIETGYDWVVDAATLGPRFSIRYRETDIDGYTEAISSGNPLPLVFADQTERSLTSHLGIKATRALSWKYGVLIPQAYLAYVHEFQDNQRNILFSFRDDLNNTVFVYNNDKPDRNFGNLMLGMVAVFPRGIQAFVNYEKLLGYNDHDDDLITVGVNFEL